jgi:hypothetical protein
MLTSPPLKGKEKEKCNSSETRSDVGRGGIAEFITPHKLHSRLDLLSCNARQLFVLYLDANKEKEFIMHAMSEA